MWGDRLSSLAFLNTEADLTATLSPDDITLIYATGKGNFAYSTVLGR